MAPRRYRPGQEEREKQADEKVLTEFSQSPSATRFKEKAPALSLNTDRAEYGISASQLFSNSEFRGFCWAFVMVLIIVVGWRSLRQKLILWRLADRRRRQQEEGVDMRLPSTNGSSRDSTGSLRGSRGEALLDKLIPLDGVASRRTKMQPAKTNVRITGHATNKATWRISSELGGMGSSYSTDFSAPSRSAMPLAFSGRGRSPPSGLSPHGSGALASNEKQYSAATLLSDGMSRTGSGMLQPSHQSLVCRHGNSKEAQEWVDSLNDVRQRLLERHRETTPFSPITSKFGNGTPTQHHPMLSASPVSGTPARANPAAPVFQMVELDNDKVDSTRKRSRKDAGRHLENETDSETSSLGSARPRRHKKAQAVRKAARLEQLLQNFDEYREEEALARKPSQQGSQHVSLMSRNPTNGVQVAYPSSPLRSQRSVRDIIVDGVKEFHRQETEGGAGFKRQRTTTAFDEEDPRGPQQLRQSLHMRRLLSGSLNGGDMMTRGMSFTTAGRADGGTNTGPSATLLTFAWANSEEIDAYLASPPRRPDVQLKDYHFDRIVESRPPTPPKAPTPPREPTPPPPPPPRQATPPAKDREGSQKAQAAPIEREQVKRTPQVSFLNPAAASSPQPQTSEAEMKPQTAKGTFSFAATADNRESSEKRGDDVCSASASSAREEENSKSSERKSESPPRTSNPSSRKGSPPKQGGNDPRSSRTELRLASTNNNPFAKKPSGFPMPSARPEGTSAKVASAATNGSEQSEKTNNGVSNAPKTGVPFPSQPSPSGTSSFAPREGSESKASTLSGNVFSGASSFNKASQPTSSAFGNGLQSSSGQSSQQQSAIPAFNVQQKSNGDSQSSGSNGQPSSQPLSAATQPSTAFGGPQKTSSFGVQQASSMGQPSKTQGTAVQPSGVDQQKQSGFVSSQSISAPSGGIGGQNGGGISAGQAQPSAPQTSSSFGGQQKQSSFGGQQPTSGFPNQPSNGFVGQQNASNPLGGALSKSSSDFGTQQQTGASSLGNGQAQGPHSQPPQQQATGTQPHSGFAGPQNPGGFSSQPSSSTGPSQQIQSSSTAFGGQQKPGNFAGSQTSTLALSPSGLGGQHSASGSQPPMSGFGGQQTPSSFSGQSGFGNQPNANGFGGQHQQVSASAGAMGQMSMGQMSRQQSGPQSPSGFSGGQQTTGFGTGQTNQSNGLPPRQQGFNGHSSTAFQQMPMNVGGQSQQASGFGNGQQQQTSALGSGQSQSLVAFSGMQGGLGGQQGARFPAPVQQQTSPSGGLPYLQSQQAPLQGASVSQTRWEAPQQPRPKAIMKPNQPTAIGGGNTFPTATAGFPAAGTTQFPAPNSSGTQNPSGRRSHSKPKVRRA